MKHTGATKLSLVSVITFCVAFSTSPGFAGVINPFDLQVNIDGTVDLADMTGLDAEGLGTLTFSVSGAGAHNVDLFADYDIDDSINTYFNEYGSVSGTAAAGQSWEIDEPGYLFGDIYDNLWDSTLDNFNNVPSGWDDDVSLALGWDFTLGADQIATIAYTLSRTDTGAGLYLSQWDPDSQDGFHMFSTLDISTVGVPAPASLLLLMTGLFGLGLVRRR